MKIDKQQFAFDWMKDGKKLKEEFGFTESKYVESSVTIEDAGEYWVEIYSRDHPETSRISTRKCQVKVEVPEKETIHIYYHDQEVTSTLVENGEVHTLTVVLKPSGSTQGWRITDSGDANIAAIQVNGDFLEVRGVNEGVTDCTVAIVDDPSATASLNVTITPRHDRAPVFIRDLPQTMEVPKGSVLFVEVAPDHNTWNGSANPTTDTIKWFKNGVELTENDTPTWNTERVIFWDMRESYNGEYHCVLTNEFGSTESVHCTVTMKTE